jgi:hypothetical protein
MAATKTEVIVSKLIDHLGTPFQWQNLCVRGLPFQWNIAQCRNTDPEMKNVRYAATKPELLISKLTEHDMTNK